MKVIWTPEARIDLKRQVQYIAAHDEAAARRTRIKVMQAVASLNEFPHRCRAGRVLNTRELVVAGTPFVLPYRIFGATLYILRLMHTAQQWPESFDA